MWLWKDFSYPFGFSLCPAAQEAININRGCLLSGQLSSVICFSNPSARVPKMLCSPKEISASSKLAQLFLISITVTWGWNLSLLTSFPCLMYMQNSSFLLLHSNLLQSLKNGIMFSLCLLSRLNAIYFSCPPWNSFLELSEFLFSFLPPAPFSWLPFST